MSESGSTNSFISSLPRVLAHLQEQFNNMDTAYSQLKDDLLKQKTLNRRLFKSYRSLTVRINEAKRLLTVGCGNKKRRVVPKRRPTSNNTIDNHILTTNAIQLKSEPTDTAEEEITNSVDELPSLISQHNSDTEDIKIQPNFSLNEKVQTMDKNNFNTNDHNSDSQTSKHHNGNCIFKKLPPELERIFGGVRTRRRSLAVDRYLNRFSLFPNSDNGSNGISSNSDSQSEKSYDGKSNSVSLGLKNKPNVANKDPHIGSAATEDKFATTHKDMASCKAAAKRFEFRSASKVTSRYRTNNTNNSS